MIFADVIGTQELFFVLIGVFFFGLLPIKKKSEGLNHDFQDESMLRMRRVANYLNK